MIIQSGITTAYISFVAVDAQDKSTRETGLTGFTVYRTRNGAAAVAMTTPTVTEIDPINMPGVYWLLLDEDTTIDGSNGNEELVVHITHPDMASVTRAVEISTLSLAVIDDITINGIVSDGAPSTSSFNVTGLPLDASQYVGQYLIITSGNMQGISREVSKDSNGTEIHLKQPLPSAPADATPFAIGGSA